MVFALVAATAVLVLRVAVRRILRRSLGPERAVIIGDSVSIPLLTRKLRLHQEYGIEVVGVVSGAERGAPRRRSTSRTSRHVTGSTGSSSPARTRSRARWRTSSDVRTGWSSRSTTSPHPLDVVGAGMEVDDIEGVTVFGLYPPVLCRSSRCVKRAMDVLGATALLVLAAPVMLWIAAAVALDSRGPVLFRDERIGRSGRRFRIAKFRTMVVGAEGMTEQLRGRSLDSHWLLLDPDPRVTRVGRLLRRSSLDELPQLWSVLKGDMSLVGPRPLIEAEDRQITGWARGRLDLTPGLTGLWQVLGRTSIPFEEMVKLDYIYVTNWSVWRDVQLLLRTLPVVLTRRGAN